MMIRTQMENQRFIIGTDVWRALDIEEVSATACGLQRLGLYQLPYPSVDIEFIAEDFFWMLSQQSAAGKEEIEKLRKAATTDALPLGVVFRLLDVTVIPNHSPTLHWYSYINKHLSDPMFTDDSKRLESFRGTFCMVLISLLAVRNIRKTQTTDKLARLGIGKSKHRYTYTTTLSLPAEITDADDSVATGKKLCPHFRRGHIRNQAFGPRGQLRKAIWIEPTFIHVDEDYLKRRTAYNVSSDSIRA